MIKIILAALLVLLPQYARAAQAYLHDMSGSVQIQTGTAKPVVAVKNAHLENDTTVTTGADSTAVIKFVDGQVVALGANSALQISSYSYDAQAPSKSSSVLGLVRGGLRYISGLLASTNRAAYRLNTPSATIGIRGTEFMVQIGSTYLQMVQGSATMTNVAGTNVFGAGQFGFAATPTTIPVPIASSQVPAAIVQSFNQLAAIPVPPATPVSMPPAPPGAPGTTTGLPPAAAGIAAAAAAAAAALSAGDDSAIQHSTTTHH